MVKEVGRARLSRTVDNADATQYNTQRKVETTVSVAYPDRNRNNDAQDNLCAIARVSG
jgi:hypothetical protein